MWLEKLVILCNNTDTQICKYDPTLILWLYGIFDHIWSCLFLYLITSPGKIPAMFHGFLGLSGLAIGEVVAHSGCPVVKGPPAPGWIGEWLLGIGRFQGRFQVLCDVVCVYSSVFLPPSLSMSWCEKHHVLVFFFPKGFDVSVIKAGISFADGLLLALEFTSSNAAAVDLQSGHGKGGLIWDAEFHSRRLEVYNFTKEQDEGSSENCFQHLKMQFPTSLPSLPSLLLRSWRFRGPWPCFLWGWVHHAALSVGLTLRQICTHPIYGQRYIEKFSQSNKKVSDWAAGTTILHCINLYIDYCI